MVCHTIKFHKDIHNSEAVHKANMFECCPQNSSKRGIFLLVACSKGETFED